MRLGPFFISAAALATGELTALARSSRFPIPPAVLLGGAIVTLLFAIARRRAASGRPAHRPSLSGAACAAACFIAGLSLGADAGRTSRASCTAGLSKGDAVYARGRLTGPLPAGTSTRRVSLAGAELSSRHGRCRIPRLSVLLEDIASAPRTPGTGRLAVRGTWRTYGDTERRRPRSPDRYGYVKGRPLESHPPGLDGGPGLLDGMRGAAIERLRARLPADVRGVAVAMMLAERSEVSPLMSRRFAQSGLAHLMAISGLHVGILAALCTGLFALLGAARWRYPLAATAIATYVIAIGAPPAAMRAGLIFGLYCIARQRGSPRQFTDLVGVAAIVALLARPLVLLEPGFQLSFAGFLGVAVGNRCATRWIAASGPAPRWAAAAVRLLVVGAAATLATAPFAALHFQRAAPIAVVSSWIGTPLVALTLPALIGALVLPAPIAALFASAATALLRVLVAIVTWFASLPVGHGSVAPPRADQWIAFVLLAIGAARFATGRRPGRALWPALTAVAVWLAGPAVVHAPLRGRTLICSLSVGQGDAAAIRTRRGNWIVIDAGPVGGARGPLLRFLRRHDAHAVELFSLSHPHLDHMAALPDLLAAYRVRRVLDAGNPLPSDRYAEFLEAARAEGAQWLRGRSGAELQVDEVRIRVLGPARGDAPVAARSGVERIGPGYADANEASLSLRVAVREFVYVSTGDAPILQETAMAGRWRPELLRADVLKLGHHGSRTSSSVDWLRTVRPTIAIISAGRRNRYGHPHPETLARLDSAGIERVWRTAEEGTLCIEVERNGLWRIRPPS